MHVDMYSSLVSFAVSFYIVLFMLAWFAEGPEV
jgi:hypothetical protein